MSKYFSWQILLFLFSYIALADLGPSNPIVIKDDDIVESLEEIDDLNRNKSIQKESLAGKTFTHRDEDMLADLKQSNIFASLKYDVEILESSEVKREDVQIEERYRGPAITLNTDNFINENIEVNTNNVDSDKSVSKKNLATNDLILCVILVLVALVIIGLYVILVVWRSRIQQPYGMRELLVTNDNQEYWPQDVITSVVAQHQQQYQQQKQQLQRQQQLQS